MIPILLTAGLLLSAPTSPAPSPTPTQTVTGGSVSIFGSSFEVPAGEVRDGNVVVYGGSVDIEGTVTHDLRVYGGSAEVAGSVGHNVVVVGGSVHLGPNATVGHDVTVVAGSLSRDPGAVVGHDVVQERATPDLPVPPPLLSPDLPLGLGVAVGVVLFALLLQLFLPGHVATTRAALEERPFASLGYGCLSAVAGVLLAALLAITVVLLLASVAIVVAMAAAWLLGVAAAIVLIGQRLATALRLKADPVPALLLGGALAAVLVNVPVLGGLFGLVLGTMALGAVVLTRFGTRSHPPGSPTFAQPPAGVSR